MINTGVFLEFYSFFRGLVIFCYYTKLNIGYIFLRGPGYLSRYSISPRDGRSGDRIPVGARFSAPVQTGPGAHPASYKIVTESLSRG
jgi:hypothetical protein